MWWDNFVDCWLFFLFLYGKKLILYCSGTVACGWVPCNRAARFCSFWLWQDKSACIPRSTKCHLSLQLHPFLLFVFQLCSCNEKGKKWMHEKRKWCHQSNPFACKGKDSTYNQLAEGHENILKGNWAHFVEILWYIPLTCSVLLRNNAYRQRHNTRPFSLYSVPKNAVIIVYSIILKLVLFMCCFWSSMYTKGSNFPRQGFLCFHPWCSLQASGRRLYLFQTLLRVHLCSHVSCRVWVESWSCYYLFLIEQLAIAPVFALTPFCLEHLSPHFPSHLLSCTDSGACSPYKF